MSQKQNEMSRTWESKTDAYGMVQNGQKLAHLWPVLVKKRRRKKKKKTIAL